MRVLIVTPYYWPELFRITDVAKGLRDRGHTVGVLTGLPNYPSGTVFSGYGFTGPFREERDGVSIRRVPMVPRGRGGALRLILNYLSYAITGSFRAMTVGREGWDVTFVFQVSPVTSILPAAVLRAIYGVPVVAWVQDLWPDVVESSGLARSKVMLRAIRAMSRWLYRRCDLILGSSRAFGPKLQRLGVAEVPFGYLPQWAEESFTTASASVEVPTTEWADGFPLMFAGNLGRVQGLETLLDCADLLRDDQEVKWVFLGDGSSREWLAEEARRRGLDRRVILLGRRPVEEMPAYFEKAAAMLVSLKPDDTMALVIPAKLQAYLAAGRPIVGSIDGEAARVIEESGGGWAAPAGDPVALAAVVRRLKALSPEARSEMGARGREYSGRHFSRSGCLDELERALAITGIRSN